MYLIAGYGQISFGPQSLERETLQAGIVCVGSTVAQVNDHHGESVAASLPEYHIRVLRAYKGTLAGQNLTVVSNDSLDDRTISTRYLFFIAEGDGSKAGNLLSAIRLPTDFPVANVDGGQNSIENDLDQYASTPNADIDFALNMIGRLTSLSDQTHKTLEKLTGGDNHVALLSFLILLKHGTGSPTEFQSFLRLLEKTPAAQYPDMRDFSYIMVQYAHKENLLDLESLASSGDPRLSLPALQGIRKISSPDATAFLLSELDNNSIMMEYTALTTLAEIYKKGGDYGPGMGIFEQNPKRYVQLWKKWYAEQPNASRQVLNSSGYHLQAVS